MRGSAVKALGALLELAAPYVPAIAALLEDKDGFVRSSAVEALGALGELAAPHVLAIAALLEDKDGQVRSSAVEALGALGELLLSLLCSNIRAVACAPLL